MKLFNKSIGAFATIFIAGALIFTTSCTKDNDGPANTEPQKAEVKIITDKVMQDEIQAAADRTPPIAWYNKTMDKVIVYNPHQKSKSFSFSDPSDGWNFSSNQGVYWTQNPAGGGVLFITPGAFGTGGGGGVVTAGNTTLAIDFTFCFSADESAMGFEPGDFGDFSGLSGVIGIAGNTSALENENFDEEGVDIENFFLGAAVYLVFEDQPSGNYSVLNYTGDDVDLNELDDEVVQGKAVSIVMSFDSNSVGFYVSSGGTMNVNGGTMSFNGQYHGFELNFNDLLEENEEGEDVDLEFLEATFVEVSGSGSMGC